MKTLKNQILESIGKTGKERDTEIRREYASIKRKLNQKAKEKGFKSYEEMSMAEIKKTFDENDWFGLKGDERVLAWHWLIYED